MSIDDEPLGYLHIDLPPLPPKHIRHTWYDQYASVFDAWLQAEIEKQLPAAIYGKLSQEAYQQARFYLLGVVSNTLMNITTRAVTLHKLDGN